MVNAYCCTYPVWSFLPLWLVLPMAPANQLIKPSMILTSPIVYRNLCELVDQTVDEDVIVDLVNLILVEEQVVDTLELVSDAVREATCFSHTANRPA